MPSKVAPAAARPVCLTNSRRVVASAAGLLMKISYKVWAGQGGRHGTLLAYLEPGWKFVQPLAERSFPVSPRKPANASRGKPPGPFALYRWGNNFWPNLPSESLIPNSPRTTTNSTARRVERLWKPARAQGDDQRGTSIQVRWSDAGDAPRVVDSRPADLAARPTGRRDRHDSRDGRKLGARRIAAARSGGRRPCWSLADGLPRYGR